MLLSSSILPQMTTRTKLLLLFALALVVRLGALVFLQDLDRVFEYQLIAQNLLHGKGFSWDEWGRFSLQPTSLFVPLYVLWCALFGAIAGKSTLLMYICQCAISASGTYPMYKLASEWWSVRTGQMAALAFAIYPEMIFLPIRAVPEFAYVVMVLWMLWAYVVVRKIETSQIGPWLVIGLAAICVITILTKEGAVIIAVSVGIMLVWKKKPRNLALARLHIPLILTGIILFSPWWIYNYRTQGVFIPLRTGIGLNLFMGNHDKATGTDKTINGDYQLSLRWHEFGENKTGILPDDEQQRDRFYGDTAKSWIASHPREYLVLCLKRLKYYLWFDPTHYLASNMVYRMSYVILLLLALPGLYLLVKRRLLDGVIVLSVLGYLALYVPTIVLPRYRIILVLFQLMFASYLVSTLWDTLAKRKAIREKHS